MILITGASGKTGKAILQELVSAGASVRVRVFVHRPDQEKEFLGLGAKEVVCGDIRDQEAIFAAVKGVDTIYHICPNMSPDELEIGRVIISAAKYHGVSSFVYHSVLHPQVPAMKHHWNKLLVEGELFSSGLDFSIVQPTAYMQNILAYWPAICASGIYAPPYAPDTRLGLVDLADVAAAAVKIILQPDYRGGIFELVGTPAYSQTEIAEIIGLKLGKTVQVESQSRKTWETNARRNNLPEYSIKTLLAMFEYYESYGMWGSPFVLESVLDRRSTSFDQFIDQQLVEEDHEVGMPFKQNQHEKFAFEVLPLIFHNETREFFVYLRRDGEKFLKFWWDRAGVNLDESLRSSSEGIDFEIRTVPDGREVVLLTLPAPKKAPEAYYLAMVDRPAKRSFFSWRNLGRVFALSRSVDENGTPNTIIAELTKTARYVEVKKGPQPNKKLFYKSVCDLLDNKKKKK